MPDKKIPDWSEDPAFWDESWADMNARLDRRRRPRPLWLLWLLLPLLIGGAVWLWQSPADPLPAVVTEPRELIAIKDATVDGQSVALDKKAAPSAPKRSPAYSAEEKVLTTRSLLLSAGTPHPTPAVLTQPQPVPSAISQKDIAPARRAQTVVMPLESQMTPYLTSVTFPLIQIEITDSALQPHGIEGKLITPNLRTYHWATSIGLSYYPTAPRPGYFLQTSYEVMAGKWVLPVSIRLERSTRQVSTNDAVADGREFYPSFQVDQNAVTGNSFSRQLRLSGRDVLSVTTLEARAGIGRYLGGRKRLMISGGPGVTYLLGGTGPTFPTNPSPSADINVTENNLTYQGSSNAVQLSSGRTDRGVNIAVDRWDLTGWLQADYQIGKRLRLSGSWTHTATAFYADPLLHTDRNSFSVGVGYRY